MFVLVFMIINNHSWYLFCSINSKIINIKKKGKKKRIFYLKTEKKESIQIYPEIISMKSKSISINKTHLTQMCRIEIITEYFNILMKIWIVYF